MLTACFDAGGKERDHDVVVVAGFASAAQVWKDFETAWRVRLDQDGLPEFHAGDFAHFTGAFKHGWSGEENDAKRKDLLRDLMGIIESQGLQKFVVIVPIDVHHAIDKELRKRLLVDAYVVGSMLAIGDFHQHAKRMGTERNLRYVFEKGDSEDLLRKRLEADGYETPDFEWKVPTVSRKGIHRDGFLGLQAAGWLAYEYYLSANRMLQDGPNNRWPIEQFEKMPGHPHIQTRESAYANELAMRIADETAYLGKVKQ
jgi:hypothetical protein